MLAEKRRALILETLTVNGSVSVTELSRRLKVSRETIRRDITKLDAENRLRKTHGGALSLDSVEPAVEDRMQVNIDGKRAIARRAAEMVADGASLILGCGTTTLCLAEALVGFRRLTIYTNDVQVAARLAGRNENRVFLLGGELLGAQGATFGRDATAMQAGYYADVAFVSPGVLSGHPWLMDYTREAAALHESMIAQARTVVLLVDHTKFGRTAPARVAAFERAKCLITDQAPPTAAARELKSLADEIIVAS
ncbi:MAG: DeoR/GlpR transcriptional regulator [Alphaproteobacteria bacterium]|nr:DeoR/GlpR transcriptional regulator [Alphaproteobacteria bacterium]